MEHKLLDGPYVHKHESKLWRSWLALALFGFPLLPRAVATHCGSHGSGCKRRPWNDFAKSSEMPRRFALRLRWPHDRSSLIAVHRRIPKLPRHVHKKSRCRQMSIRCPIHEKTVLCYTVPQQDRKLLHCNTLRTFGPAQDETAGCLIAAICNPLLFKFEKTSRHQLT